jgi:hypothetical protein
MAELLASRSALQAGALIVLLPRAIQIITRAYAKESSITLEIANPISLLTTYSTGATALQATVDNICS